MLRNEASGCLAGWLLGHEILRLRAQNDTYNVSMHSGRGKQVNRHLPHFELHALGPETGLRVR